MDGTSAPRPVVLFDLDGTLSDSAPGILGSLRKAFTDHGVPQLDPVTERSLLGPPFYESLPPFLGPVPLADVIASYRTYYGAGAMYDTEVYAGVRDLLDSLRACGLRLAVATSKPEHYAVPIVEGLGLAEYFDTIGGDELDGSLGTKALVIGKVLSRLGRPDNVVMIGDRQHDVEGARVHGIPCVGAGWGYGQPGELEAAGAITVCPDPVAALPFLTARAG